MTLPAPAPGEREIMSAGALARHGLSGPTSLLSLTDEEVLTLVDDPVREKVHLPWVEAQEASEQGFSRLQTRLSSARSLFARGILAPEFAVAQVEGREPRDDTDKATPNALVTGIIVRRRLAVVTLDAVDELRLRGAFMLFIDRDGSILQEQVSPQGVHHFVMTDAGNARDALRAFTIPLLDADERYKTPRDHDGRVLWNGAIDGFLDDRTLLDVLGETTACVRLESTGENPGTLWLLSGEDALALVQESEDDPGRAEAISLTYAEAAEILLSVIGAGTTGSTPDSE